MSTATLTSNLPAKLPPTADAPWSRPQAVAQPEDNSPLVGLPPCTVQASGQSKNLNHIFCRGAIESVTLPKGWVRFDNRCRSSDDGQLEVFSPCLDPWFQIAIHHRQDTLSVESSRAFEELMQSKPATNGPEVLMPKEIRSLCEVMGWVTVGNNQFTNHEPAGSKAAATFYLRHAHMAQLNGRTVLVVHGDFVDPQDEARTPVQSFEGIFVDGGIDPESGCYKMQEIFMRGPVNRMLRYRQLLNETLNSIEWLD